MKNPRKVSADSTDAIGGSALTSGRVEKQNSNWHERARPRTALIYPFISQAHILLLSVRKSDGILHLLSDPAKKCRAYAMS